MIFCCDDKKKEDKYMLGRNIYLFDDINDAQKVGLTTDANHIELAEDLDTLVEGCFAVLFVEKFDSETYPLAEHCVKTIRGNIGDKGSFRLVVSTEAFSELTGGQRKVLLVNCTKYFVFMGTVGAYTIYKVCGDVRCDKHTFAVYCGTTLKAEAFGNIDAAIGYATQLSEDEEKGDGEKPQEEKQAEQPEQVEQEKQDKAEETSAPETEKKESTLDEALDYVKPKAPGLKI